MRILRAAHLGMCFGVRDAVALAEHHAAAGPLTILGDLVHNPTVLSALEARGIATRPIVAGNLSLQPAFRNSVHRVVGPLVNATVIGERGLFVGNHPSLTRGHLDHIARGFREFFGA